MSEFICIQLKECNYGYYDHTGFKRVIEISSPVLDDYGSENNRFAYVKLCVETTIELKNTEIATN